MPLRRQCLPLVFDHRCFSLVLKPYLPVWVCPIISLKARLPLTFLMVSLTFLLFPVFNIDFRDFITSSFESSSIIRSLIFPDLNFYTIDSNGDFNAACMQNKAISDRPRGKPNHFHVYLFIFASIHSTIYVAISYSSSNHNNIGINICWRHQTLNFPWRGLQSILWRSSCNVLDVSFTKHLSKLIKPKSQTFLRFFRHSRDILTTDHEMYILLHFFFSLSERHQDFLDLDSILHQIICLSIRLSILRVEDSLDGKIVVSSMNVFNGSIWSPPPRSTISALFSVTLLERKVLVTPDITSQFKFQAWFNILYIFCGEPHEVPSKYVPSILVISFGIW